MRETTLFMYIADKTDFQDPNVIKFYICQTIKGHKIKYCFFSKHRRIWEVRTHTPENFLDLRLTSTTRYIHSHVTQKHEVDTLMHVSFL